jgi:hypothetical protein
VEGVEARRGSGSLPEVDKSPRARTTSNGVASSYRHAHGVRGMGRLRCGVQCMAVLRQCEHARAGIERSEAAIGRSWRGGDAEGIFVRTPVARRSARQGAGGGHTAHMGMLAHSAYMAGAR